MAELNYYEQQEQDATARVASLLSLPPIPVHSCYDDGECFDPWSLFPSLYGSYSSDFDDMAIEVLTDILECNVVRFDLASEMFREILCRSGLCDYGTSPPCASHQLASSHCCRR